MVVCVVRCIHADCAYAEQPDTFIVDFYDAEHLFTCLSEWNCDWKKRVVMFVRNSPSPRPLTPGASGSHDWHARMPGGGRGTSTYQ